MPTQAKALSPYSIDWQRLNGNGYKERGMSVIRTHSLHCSISYADADALNRESGRIYSDTLVWHYRAFRRSGVWLSPYGAEKWGDFRTDTTLHAHSRDAAQQAFYKACKVAKANRHAGAKYPHKRKFYRTTTWKSTGIRAKDGRLLLARAKGLEPITIALPVDLASLPKAAFIETRLVYDMGTKRYHWHVIIDDGAVASQPPGDKTLAVDLGEIHPMAVANERGEVAIFTGRELRAVNQYRHKRLAGLQQRQGKCQKQSRLWKRLQRRKAQLLAKNKRQVRDIEHKITRAVVNHAVSECASRVVVGDIRGIADGKRLAAKSQQKIGGWSHGRQVDYLTYKLAAEGIRLDRQNESYSSKTCCKCGAINKPKGRNYVCASCGFVGHRDGSAACNQESKALYGIYGRIQPISTKYRRAFDRRRSSPGHGASSLADCLPRTATELSNNHTTRSVTMDLKGDHPP